MQHKQNKNATNISKQHTKQKKEKKFHIGH